MVSRTISQLAREAGVSVDTVRYYERIGLLPKPPRLGAAWRRYPEEALARLRYLRSGKSVGLSLAEMRRLLRLTRTGRPAFCEAFDATVLAKISSIDALVRDLLSQRERLESFSKACRARRREQRCPILENLKVIGDPPQKR